MGFREYFFEQDDRNEDLGEHGRNYYLSPDVAFTKTIPQTKRQDVAFIYFPDHDKLIFEAFVYHDELLKNYLKSREMSPEDYALFSKRGIWGRIYVYKGQKNVSLWEPNRYILAKGISKWITQEPQNLLKLLEKLKTTHLITDNDNLPISIDAPHTVGSMIAELRAAKGNTPMKYQRGGIPYTAARAAAHTVPGLKKALGNAPRGFGSGKKVGRGDMTRAEYNALLKTSESIRPDNL